MADLDARYGSEPVYMDRMMDSAHCLADRSRWLLLERLDRFEAMFPEVFFAVYIAALPEQTPVREFGFWLLNRGAVGSVDITRPNENGILLVLDLNARAASLSIGYGLEHVLDCRASEPCLAAATGEWRSGYYGAGIIRCIDAVTAVLRKGATKAEAPGNGVWSALPPGLKPLRQAHRSEPEQSRSDGFGSFHEQEGGC